MQFHGLESGDRHRRARQQRRREDLRGQLGIELDVDRFEDPKKAGSPGGPRRAGSHRAPRRSPGRSRRRRLSASPGPWPTDEPGCPSFVRPARDGDQFHHVLPRESVVTVSPPTSNSARIRSGFAHHRRHCDSRSTLRSDLARRPSGLPGRAVARRNARIDRSSRVQSRPSMRMVLHRSSAVCISSSRSPSSLIGAGPGSCHGFKEVRGEVRAELAPRPVEPSRPHEDEIESLGFSRGVPPD